MITPDHDPQQKKAKNSAYPTPELFKSAKSQPVDHKKPEDAIPVSVATATNSKTKVSDSTFEKSLDRNEN